ncbi:MAG: branched-chain amino acid ABC transporter permease [Rhodospirillales bacterium]|nr:MAG: High-affinity branched-chain amino acid transport system permease protein LivH [Alphaproteobacteria bacterium MarineAlpha10_Bin3]PPR66576.1 MAG: High-affinity branched-chain amino acid transport system permease protein LivH [Alphaproteobacteria bacterium MarineAlpha4_Bin1]
MTDLLELLVSVGEAGCIYGLVALSYLLVLRPTGIINFAAGEWVGLGAFAGVTLIAQGKLPWIVGLPLAVLAVGLIGWLTERLTIRPLVEGGASVLSPVLALLGMLVVYRESASLIWGVDNMFVPMPFGFGRVEVGPFAGSSQSFFILTITAGVFLLVWLLFEKTVWGKAFEAVALNRMAAALMGINLKLVAAMAFFGGAAVAGVAGLLVAPITSVHFLMGLPLAIKGFTALVIGGVGRVEGALLGGLLLALVEKLTLRYAPIPSGFAIGVPFVMLILFLMLRPGGLLRAKGGD